MCGEQTYRRFTVKRIGGTIMNEEKKVENQEVVGGSFTLRYEGKDYNVALSGVQVSYSPACPETRPVHTFTFVEV